MAKKMPKGLANLKQAMEMSAMDIKTDKAMVKPKAKAKTKVTAKPKMKKKC